MKSGLKGPVASNGSTERGRTDERLATPEQGDWYSKQKGVGLDVRRLQVDFESLGRVPLFRDV